MATPITHAVDDQPFGMLGRNGCRFMAPRCDLKDGELLVTVPKGLTQEQIASDCFQAGAWHAHMVHQRLKSFAGYDAVRFRFVEGK